MCADHPRFHDFSGDTLKVDGGLLTVQDDVAIGRCCKVFAGILEGESKFEVAVKVFALGDEYETALRRELEFLQLLSPHRHIVNLIDNFTRNDHNILIQELLCGTLKDISAMHSERSPSQWLAQKLCRDLIAGLSHLKNCGVIHGDVKPQNIMWCGNSEVFKFIDFGVSYRDSETLRHRIQSKAYSAPEVTHWNESMRENNTSMGPSLQPSFAADMWAVGCIIAQFVFGFKVWIKCGLNGLNVEKELPVDWTSITESLTLKNGYFLQFSRDLVHFFQRCLELKVEHRVSVEEAQKLSFLSSVHWTTSSPSLFDLLILPTSVVRLLNLVPEKTSPEVVNDVLDQILSSVSLSGAVPVSGLTLDASSGSFYLAFSDAHLAQHVYSHFKSQKTIAGFTTVPTFFPVQDYLNEKFTSR